MKKNQSKEIKQPTPFTPGLDKTSVREHAFRLFRDKLAHGKLSLEDWVLAEKDLVQQIQAGEMVEG